MHLKRNLVLTIILMVWGMPSMIFAESKNWYETVKLSGDMRFRFENIQEETLADRDRQSIRARLGLEAAPSEEWRAAFRLASGATSPISSEQVLGDNFTRKSIGLDLAFLEYTGFPIKASLLGGKMENPFIAAGKSQLIWDGDLNLEGLAGKVDQEILSDLSLCLRGGGFWVGEKAANLDPMLYGAQTGAIWKINDIKVTAGFGYFYYTEITNQYAFDYAASNTATAKGYGNTLAGGKYNNNYMLGEGFAEVTFRLLDLPMKICSNYVLNNGATESNHGYLIGLNINQAKEPGTWEAGYHYRWLEEDAVVAAFCDSSFLGGGTDGSGHNLNIAYAIANKVKACMTYFLCQKNIEDPKYYRRFQADISLAY